MRHERDQNTSLTLASSLQVIRGNAQCECHPTQVRQKEGLKMEQLGNGHLIAIKTYWSFNGKYAIK
jgi:hypothetical protein